MGPRGHFTKRVSKPYGRKSTERVNGGELNDAWSVLCIPSLCVKYYIRKNYIQIGIEYLIRHV